MGKTNFKQTLLQVSLTSLIAMSSVNAGVYNASSHVLMLNNVRVTQGTQVISQQLSLLYQDGSLVCPSQGSCFTPSISTAPLYDGTLLLDTTKNKWILTILSASGFYGIAIGDQPQGPFLLTEVTGIDTMGVGAIGPKGDRGPVGPTGPKGDTGPAGPAGPKGETGATGPQGYGGYDGAQGPQGANGKTILSGPVDPSTQGVQGDFYLNTSSKTLFGPKGATTWPTPGTSLIGPAGSNGSTILSGSASPTAGVGSNGDFYLETSTYEMYGPKASGTWPTPPVKLTKIPGQYKIGDTGPGGGIVFFVDYNDQYPNFDYMEVSPVDLSTAAQWCSDTSSSLSLDGWDKKAIGSGKANTDAMVLGSTPACTSGAANIAHNYTGPDANHVNNDWFLPSLGEFKVMYDNLLATGIGGFIPAFYWSSSEKDASQAWFQTFTAGHQNPNTKTNQFSVRAVRAF